ncbi:methylated-DNA--[protein]-cysteine S-methyltransferase [Cohnella caldifontis]|uniref:methylated-DNA--[protein]-cysteine S-methyltransferase n=1 Tax=Cohnella caldifontis TaxID=3027471 RepID=UPI0023EDD86A|nr:methylated-DNA--[protein]-cysteine S-methyltransferase [Cohnella sp. YIM B05605]
MSPKTSMVYWESLRVPLFGGKEIFLAATERGLCRITWPQEAYEVLRAWADKRWPDAAWIRNGGRIAEYAGQMASYFEGTRQAFDIPLDLRGTEFQVAVWRRLARIPYGECRSYSEIAREIGRPAAVRAVSAAVGANPLSIVVPCHRVLGKNGALTGFRGGLQAKEALLRLEGFEAFSAKGHARFRF